MDRPVELVPLLCLKCGQPIPAALNEVAWVCSQCGQGQRLVEEAAVENGGQPATPAGLIPLDIHYSATIPPNGKGRPFWVAEGTVLLQRQTYGSSRTREAQDYWNSPRRFFIPAYDCPLEEALQESLQRLARPEQLPPGPPVAFLPVTLPEEDLQALAEFVVMVIEAKRKDKLREVVFSVRLEPPDLWILP